MTDCEQVLGILRDGKPHRNFDLIDEFGGGFALAARINDLKNQGHDIQSGTPKKFGKVRQEKGDWYYQLKIPAFTLKKLLEIKKIMEEPEEEKQLTIEFMRKHSYKLDKALG